MQSSHRWLWRVLAFGIPISPVLICLGVYLSQNYEQISRTGAMTLAVESDLMMSHADGVQLQESASTNDHALVPGRPVATKVSTKCRAGLSILGRGHGTDYEASFPEFPTTNPFLVDVNRLIGTSHSAAISEFTNVDWSLVWDEFRNPTNSNREWSGVVTTDVIFCSDNAVSLLEHHWEYTGGAHGNPWFVSKAFINADGKARKVELHELFEASTDWASHLTTYCMNDLRRQGASYLQLPEETGETTKTHEVTLGEDDLKTFGLSSTALWIFFGPYHVGCYAEGNYSVKIPYEELSKFIPTGSPARLFMQARPE